jgi:hypothetical protein
VPLGSTGVSDLLNHPGLNNMYDTDNKSALELHDASSASSGMGSYHEDESCSEEWICV